MPRKIKISAPATNPHVCYIDNKYKEDLNRIKKETGLSAFRILEICSGYSLNTREKIKAAKAALKKQGWHTIGEWAEALIEILIDLCNSGKIIHCDLSSVKIKKEK